MPTPPEEGDEAMLSSPSSTDDDERREVDFDSEEDLRSAMPQHGGKRANPIVIRRLDKVEAR